MATSCLCSVDPAAGGLHAHAHVLGPHLLLLSLILSNHPDKASRHISQGPNAGGLRIPHRFANWKEQNTERGHIPSFTPVSYWRRTHPCWSMHIAPCSVLPVNACTHTHTSVCSCQLNVHRSKNVQRFNSTDRAGISHTAYLG